MPVELLLGDLFERGELVDPRVVDEYVQASKALFASANSLSTSARLATLAWTAIALPPLPVISNTTRSAPFLSEA